MSKTRAIISSFSNGIRRALSVALAHPAWSGIGSITAVLSFVLVLYQGTDTAHPTIPTNAQETPGAEDRTRSIKPPFISQRIALVVANADYRAHLLKNPINDANAVIRQLKKKGFKIIKKMNAGRKELIKSIKDFQTLLSLGGVGVFYYAGHGMRIDGSDYIIPIDQDQNVSTETDVLKHGVNFSDLLRPVDRIIMDSPKRNGAVIVYAAAKGQLAQDGIGRHSPFAESFLKALSQQEFEIFDFYRFISKEVSEITDGKQVPWVSASVDTEFYFNRPEVDTNIGLLKILFFDSCRDNPFKHTR